MGQLPRARDTEHCELDERPSDDLAVGRLALVSEFCFAFLCVVNIFLNTLFGWRISTYSLEHLLPPDVL